MGAPNAADTPADAPATTTEAVVVDRKLLIIHRNCENRSAY